MISLIQEGAWTTYRWHITTIEHFAILKNEWLEAWCFGNEAEWTSCFFIASFSLNKPRNGLWQFHGSVRRHKMSTSVMRPSGMFTQHLESMCWVKHSQSVCALVARLKDNTSGIDMTTTTVHCLVKSQTLRHTHKRVCAQTLSRTYLWLTDGCRQGVHPLPNDKIWRSNVSDGSVEPGSAPGMFGADWVRPAALIPAFLPSCQKFASLPWLIKTIQVKRRRNKHQQGKVWGLERLKRLLAEG